VNFERSGAGVVLSASEPAASVNPVPVVVVLPDPSVPDAVVDPDPVSVAVMLPDPLACKFFKSNI
jgi:hypothetical protein